MTVPRKIIFKMSSLFEPDLSYARSITVESNITSQTREKKWKVSIWLLSSSDSWRGVSRPPLLFLLPRPLLNRTFDLVGKLLDSILLILNVCSYKSLNAKKNLKSKINRHHRLYQAQFESCVDVYIPKVMLKIRPSFSYEQERSLYLKIKYYE